MALPDRVLNTEGTEIDLRSLVDTVRRMYVSDPERAEWLMDDIVSYLPPEHRTAFVLEVQPIPDMESAMTTEAVQEVKMVDIPVSKLKSHCLDYAMALAQGHTSNNIVLNPRGRGRGVWIGPHEYALLHKYSPSTGFYSGIPLLQRMKPHIMWERDRCVVRLVAEGDAEVVGEGSTMLEAFCRAYVLKTFDKFGTGDVKVSIPQEIAKLVPLDD